MYKILSIFSNYSNKKIAGGKIVGLYFISRRIIRFIFGNFYQVFDGSPPYDSIFQAFYYISYSYTSGLGQAKKRNA